MQECLDQAMHSSQSEQKLHILMINITMLMLKRIPPPLYSLSESTVMTSSAVSTARTYRNLNYFNPDRLTETCATAQGNYWHPQSREVAFRCVFVLL